MIGTVGTVFEVGRHDEFLAARIASGTSSRLGLMASLCKAAGRSDFRTSGEAQWVVDEFCDRLAPDLPDRPALTWKMAGKIVGFAILSAASYYRIAHLWQMIPVPLRSCLSGAFLVAMVLVLALGPRLASARRDRGTGRGVGSG